MLAGQPIAATIGYGTKGDIITPFSNAAGSQGAVVTMADLSTLEVEADVSEGSLSKAQIGQQRGSHLPVTTC